MSAVRNLVVTLIALIAFIFVADKLVWDSQVWECTCSHSNCGWCSNVPADVTDYSWDPFHWDAYNEYLSEFTTLFNSYETKHASNGVLLIRSGSSGSYRFAKRSI